jgi:hypothetical protein
LLLPGAHLAGQEQGAAHAKSATPVFIELFTSEGCSSCPPADAFLKKLDQLQPIGGGQAIVLSEHVDYWNYEGWTDPYSSGSFSMRQAAYVRALGGDSPYTPEFIVNGKTEMDLAKPEQVSRILLDAAKSAQLPVSIGAVRIEGDSPAVLHARIDADGTGAKRNADVFVAIALDHAESQVLHGENGGRRLEHAAVVVDLVRAGKLEKGRPFSQEFQTRLKPGLDAKNLRLVVFVQEPGPGNVLGSALQEVRPDTK